MEAQKHTILVVDDDPGLRDLLERYLTEEGFAVATAADGTAMTAQLQRDAVDLVVLDLMLPGEDGLSIARRLRAKGDLPILILSARGDEVERIIGLELGADDYLPKPFNPRELLARIRAILRRRSNISTAPEVHDVRNFGRFRVDLTTQTLKRDDETVTLTSGEFALLRVFLDSPNRVLSRDSLVDKLKGYDRSPFDRSIDVRIARLRRKIEPDPANPEYILTEWGQGYRFSPDGRMIVTQ